MPNRDDDRLDDSSDPSAKEIERVEKRTVRRYALGRVDSQDDATSPDTRFTADDDAPDDLTSTLRRCGLLRNPLPLGVPHPLASAGLKLKELRARSGWTVEEIAERTGMSTDLLAAFENGDSATAGELTAFQLERLASACCGTLADLLGPEHSWVKAARRRQSLIGRTCSFDPHG